VVAKAIVVSKILCPKGRPSSSLGGATSWRLLMETRKEELLELLLQTADLVVASKTQHEANRRLVVAEKRLEPSHLTVMDGTASTFLVPINLLKEMLRAYWECE